MPPRTDCSQLLWAPVPVFDHPHGKKVFHVANENFLFSSLCSLPLILPLCTSDRTLALPSLQPPTR